MMIDKFDKFDTISLLNYSYWLLRELEGGRRNRKLWPIPERFVLDDNPIWKEVTTLLDELDSQRYPS